MQDSSSHLYFKANGFQASFLECCGLRVKQLCLMYIEYNLLCISLMHKQSNNTLTSKKLIFKVFSDIQEVKIGLERFLDHQN